jgi:hypothetical protein
MVRCGFFLCMATCLAIAHSSMVRADDSLPYLPDYSVVNNEPTNGWKVVQVDREFDRGESNIVFGRNSSALYIFTKNPDGSQTASHKLGFRGSDAAAKAEACARKFDDIAATGGQFFYSVDARGRNIMCASRK